MENLNSTIKMNFNHQQDDTGMLAALIALMILAFIVMCLLFLI